LLDRDLIRFGDLFDYFRRRRFRFLYLQPAEQADVVDHPLISRIGRGHVEGPLGDLQRKDAVTFYKVRRERAQGVGRNADSGQNSDAFARAVRPGVGILESLAQTTPRIWLRIVHCSKIDWLTSMLK